MVAAGNLVQTLFGIPYPLAVLLVGVLMTVYVTFGGMLATTWVQIVKAILLLSGCILHHSSSCLGSNDRRRDWRLALGAALRAIWTNGQIF